MVVVAAERWRRETSCVDGARVWRAAADDFSGRRDDCGVYGMEDFGRGAGECGICGADTWGDEDEGVFGEVRWLTQALMMERTFAGAWCLMEIACTCERRR